jgi:hypothetical protein
VPVLLPHLQRQQEEQQQQWQEEQPPAPAPSGATASSMAATSSSGGGSGGRGSGSSGASGATSTSQRRPPQPEVSTAVQQQMEQLGHELTAAMAMLELPVTAHPDEVRPPALSDCHVCLPARPLPELPGIAAGCSCALAPQAG